MPFVVAKVTLKAGGEYHPPGSPVEVEDNDLPTLVPSYARLATDAEVAALLGEDLPVAPVTEPEAPSTPPVEEAPPTPPAEPVNRVADIADALDLLDDATDFEAGRPKLDALAAVLGYEPTSEEVDAAMALKAATA